jgi:hypothetical protein
VEKLKIILLIIISACSNSNKCNKSNNFKNNYGVINLEFDSKPDSLFSKAINFAGLFIKDSLIQKPECYQYNFSVDKNDSIEFVVIQIFDKRKLISERSEVDAKVYKSPNHIVDLYFDEDQSYRYSRWIAETKKEQRILLRQIKRVD